MLEARISAVSRKSEKEVVEHKTTIMINSARYCNQRTGGIAHKEFRQIKFLLSKGCTFDVLDSEGHDAMHYAILNNDTMLV